MNNVKAEIDAFVSKLFLVARDLSRVGGRLDGYWRGRVSSGGNGGGVCRTRGGRSSRMASLGLPLFKALSDWIVVMRGVEGSC